MIFGINGHPEKGDYKNEYSQLSQALKKGAEVLRTISDKKGKGEQNHFPPLVLSLKKGMINSIKGDLLFSGVHGDLPV